MTPLKIFIDNNYPGKFVDALASIHDLQRQRRFEIVRWGNQSPNTDELLSSVFLLLDRGARQLEITTLKHFEAGYRVVACKMGRGGQRDLFELSMTLLRVWPDILRRAQEEPSPFIYTVRYGGEKLVPHSKA